ncbi:CorA family divalent cation transporter [Aquirufa lenticrescens]|uniref:CorA family divalent cation transporter n=1 Tax=Aquirufa lenticrescens TaxID=2696560 RepID=UPI001CAA6526|nr:CorA family divalent cation transporter [Aquirufa lenticrescens]UAJ14054.1 magnesium transporter CorA [Aquirufa lenticrescens]
MAIVIFENKEQMLTWVDVTAPSSTELTELSKTYDLNHFALSACLQPDHLPKHEDIEGTHFIITRVLMPIRSGKSVSIQSISTKIAFFYRPGLLITIHRISHDFIQDVRMRFFDKGQFKLVESIVAKLLWHILHSYELPAVGLSTELDEFENMVFSQNLTPQMLLELYQIKRKALMSKKLLLFSQEAISSVKLPVAKADDLQDSRDLHLKLLNIYDQIHEDVSNLVNFYLSISAQKTNDVIKVLTIFSVFFMPLTFVAGIYGMNFDYMPELKMRYGYPLLLGIMVLLSGGIYLWFRKKRWL